MLLMTCGAFCFSQDASALYVKGNILLAPIGILNAGLEYQLAPKYTLQGDFLISPWKSFAGRHAQIYMANAEGRYYFKEAFSKWYIGANVGGAAFDLTKWEYTGTHKFQRGFNFLVGASVGYQLKIKESVNLDFYLGAGTVQSFYHGYEEVDGQLVRYEDASGLNRSGEFLPYRGGIMLSYKLK